MIKPTKRKETEMRYSIGVDIGGTKIAIAIVNETGNIKDQIILNTDTTVGPEVVIENINKEISNLIQVNDVLIENIQGIGIGSPGPLDVRKGEITNPPNLPWRDVPIVQMVESYFDLPVKLENDANAATIAEQWIGAGTSFRNFVYMTVSTGIGAGIVSDGHLLIGGRGNAGDIGHTVVDPAFGKCTCGQEGCLEIVASGTAIAKNGSNIMGESLTTKEVFDLYHSGNDKIVEFINHVFNRLGAGCVSLINTLDIEAIIIGGGVSNVGEPLFNALQNYIGHYALNPKGRETQVIPAKLKQDPGVIGAAALWFER